MLKLKHRLSLTFLVIAMTFQCSCSDSDLKKAAQASDDIRRGVSLSLDVTSELFNQKQISPEDATFIVGILLDINRINKEFNDTARSLKSIDASNKTQLLEILGRIVDSVNRLNNQGTLRIKNPQFKTQFSVATSLIGVAVGVLQSLLGGN